MAVIWEKQFVIIGTLDTKGAEIAYLRDRLQALGLATLVIDSGILGEPIGITPRADISRAQAARLRRHNHRSAAQCRQPRQGCGRDARGAEETDAGSIRQGELAAVVSMGGAEGAVMGGAAMMQLPVGVPKVLVSPIASGKHYFDPMVGTSDIMVVHSIVDILGLNPIATTIFDNVAAAAQGAGRTWSRAAAARAGQVVTSR